MNKKKSFIFYYDWWDIFEPLSQEQKGQLITAIFDYVKNGTEPGYKDLALKISFNVIRNALKRDGEKYEKVCKRNVENGKKGGRPKNQPVFTETEKTQWVFEKPKKADNDNDNDTDNEIDNDNVNDSDKSSSSSFSTKTVCAYSDDFLNFWQEYPKKVGKGDAFNKWKKAKLTIGDKEDILSALNWQKKSERWRDNNGRYIPNPSTYISQRRWEDEPYEGLNPDYTDPSRYTGGDTLPDFILRGDY